MSIEELKARSRLTLHRKMSRSASFYQDSDALAPGDHRRAYPLRREARRRLGRDEPVLR